MSNTLTKLSARVVAGETRTWVPGTSGNPAYCITETQTVSSGSWLYIPASPPDRPVAEVRWVQGPPHTVQTQRCFPATAGTPGHYDSTPNYAVDYQLGWSGAARSIESLEDDGLYQFSVTRSSVGVVTGLNTFNEGASYSEIEHAIYAHSGTFQIMENGTAKTAPRSFAAADVFTIARVGNQIRYYQNSTLRYVSALLSTGTAFADASLYAAGDQIVDASLTETVGSFLPGSTPPSDAGDPASENRCTGYLRSLTGFAANSGDAYVNPGPPPGASGDPTETANPDTGDWPGRVGGTLRMLVGHAEAYYYGDYNEGSVEEGSVPDPSGAGAVDPSTGDWPGRVGGVLRMLVGEAYGSDGSGTHYAIGGNGRLTGLSGGGDANLLTPEFVIVEGLLGELSGFSTALPGSAGSCTGYLPGLRGFASNTTGAYVNPGPPPSTTDPIDPLTGSWAGRSGGTLPMLIGHAFDESWLSEGYENQGFLILPSPTLIGFGYTPTIADPEGHPLPGYGLYAELPPLTLAGYGGSSVGLLTLPPLGLTIEGTITIIGGLRASLPPLGLTISATVTTIGGTPRPMALPSPSLLAYGSSGGAQFGTAAGALVLPALRLTGSARAGGVASANLILPALRLTATATKITTATGLLTLPSLQMVTGAVAALALPGLTLRAIATVSVDLAYEAYSFTLMPQDDGEIGTAPTHYTNYPFERIVRFMDHYYGIGVDGIHLLEGDDFNGEPIVADVETGSEDFDYGNLKRLEAAWFAGRCGADLQVAAISAELEEPVYFLSPDKMGARAQRVIFGRGTEARYWAMRFTNPRGEDFQVEQLTPEITILKRTHGGPS